MSTTITDLERFVTYQDVQGVVKYIFPNRIEVSVILDPRPRHRFRWEVLAQTLRSRVPVSHDRFDPDGQAAGLTTGEVEILLADLAAMPNVEESR